MDNETFPRIEERTHDDAETESTGTDPDADTDADGDERPGTPLGDGSGGDANVTTPSSREALLTLTGVFCVIALLSFLLIEILTDSVIPERTIRILLGLIAALLGVDTLTSRRGS